MSTTSEDSDVESDVGFYNPLAGITDAASADKFVREAMEEATDEEYDRIARIYLGDRYDAWKRAKEAGGMDARDVARAQATHAQEEPDAST